MAAKRPKTCSSRRVKEDSRSLVLQALENKIRKERLKFYQHMGGWIGQVSEGHKTGSSTYKKLWDRKRLQSNSQVKAQKEAIESYSYKTSGSGDIEREDTTGPRDVYTDDDKSSNEDIDVEKLIADKPRPVSPFKSSKELELELAEQLALWKTPEQNMGVSFYFHRPSNEKLSSFTSSTAVVQRLQETIADKDKQIGILRQQLLKIHKESSKLVEEITRCSGPDAIHLRKENRHLKDQLERCVKENSFLRGLQMQSKNDIVKKAYRKETQAERVSQHAPRPHSTLPGSSVCRSCDKVRSSSARTCAPTKLSHHKEN